MTEPTTDDDNRAAVLRDLAMLLTLMYRHDEVDVKLVSFHNRFSHDLGDLLFEETDKALALKLLNEARDLLCRS